MKKHKKSKEELPLVEDAGDDTYNDEVEEEIKDIIGPRPIDINIKDIEAELFKVKDLPRYLRIGIFGRTGVGKTKFAGTAPNALLVDMGEKGHLTLRKTEATVFVCRSWGDMERIYWYLHKTLRRGKCPYKVVILDTATGLVDLGKKYLLDLAGMEDVDKDTVSFEGSKWNNLSILFKYWLDAWTELPINQVWLAHEKLKEDDESGYSLFPELPPVIRSQYARSVDILARMYFKTKSKRTKEGKKYKVTVTYLTAAPSEDILTKDRLFSLKGMPMKNPTFPKVFDAVYGQEE